MSKICFYTHKGGVGKSTTLINFCFCIDEYNNHIQAYNKSRNMNLNKIKILILDCDTQLNLTNFMLNYKFIHRTDEITDWENEFKLRVEIKTSDKEESTKNKEINIFDFDRYFNETSRHAMLSDNPTLSLEEQIFIRNYKFNNKNIYDLWNSVYNDSQINLENIGFDINNNLKLIGGHPLLLKMEQYLNIELLTPDIQNKKRINSFTILINELIESNNYDYVFIDLSPSSSILNQVLLFSSDRIILPCTCDNFAKYSVKTFSLWMQHWYNKHNYIHTILNKQPPILFKIIYNRYKRGNVCLETDNIRHSLTWSHSIFYSELKNYLDKYKNDENVLKYKPLSNSVSLLPDMMRYGTLMQIANKDIFYMKRHDLKDWVDSDGYADFDPIIGLTRKIYKNILVEMLIFDNKLFEEIKNEFLSINLNNCVELCSETRKRQRIQ